MNWKSKYPNVPRLRTRLPGPVAETVIARDEHYSSPSYTRVYPLVVRRAEGAAVEDVDGNVFLDFTAGIAVCGTGHCHPRVVSAIQRQAGELLHMSGTDFYYPAHAQLAQRLAELAPGDSAKRVFFTNSGAEAVEAAFKLARYHTRRPNMISFFGGFHGRTMGALSLTASKVRQRQGFEPLVPGVTQIEYPNPYRHGDTTGVRKALESLFHRTVAPEQVAAIFVEPIQGEGGYIVPPADFHQELRDICHQHGILLIVDEIQSGMGRTGRMLAIEHWGVEPDIVCLAKGIASGLPLGAIVARAEIMNWPRGSHASTFGGNPVACAAALETIDLLEEELMANAAHVGEFLISHLRDLKGRHRLIGDVRGKGLMIGAELVRDPVSLEPASSERDDVIERCFHMGLLLLGCGESTIRFCPPLVITEEDARIALDIFSDVLTEIEAPTRVAT